MTRHDGIAMAGRLVPGWWSWTLACTVVFGVCYFFYYQIGTGPTIQEKYDASVVAHIEKQLEAIGSLTPDDENIMRLVREEPALISAVGSLYRGNCAQCHAVEGGGNVGPNLTDDYFTSVTRPSDVFAVISEGVPGTAMTPWGNRLSEPQRILLAAYVVSLRGTDPPDAVPPQGSPIEPWPHR
jgi:cytochrome c oxidase cbb3-type subunit 3